MRALIGMLLAVAGLLAARPACAATEWAEVKTRHFTIYGRKSDRDLTKLATRLEKLNKLMATVLRIEEDNGEIERPLLVYVVSASDVSDAAGASTAAGLYATDKRNGYALVKRGKSVDKFDLGQETILFHEFAHHFMLARSNAAYPAWFVEGFAEFFATVQFKDDNRITFGNPPLYRAQQLVMRELYPIDRLLRGTTAGLSLSEGDRYYGAAWLLTHYLFLTPSRGKEFEAYLKDLGTPGGARDVATYFQGGEKALASELKTYVRSRLQAFSMTLSAEQIDAPKVRLLGADENALLLQDLRYKRLMPKADAEALAKEVQATATRFPDSAYAQALLGDVLADIGKWEPAMTAVDAAIRIDPDNARAHAVKAEIVLGRAGAAEGEAVRKTALREIVAANRADLNDPYPLFQYFHFKRNDGPVTELAMDGLRKAHLQLPQYSSYRWSYANALAERKDYAQAITVITPLANDPHGGNSSLAAQRRRDEFIAMRDGKPLPKREKQDEAEDEPVAEKAK